MKMKRMLSAVLALALTASLALPAGAAGGAKSSFADVSDPATAVNADVLRLMGVVSGVGGDRFNPTGKLTRAEFCTMVVKFMGLGDQAPLHATRTIFADVTAKHWALPFVNLAASQTYQDGEASIALIAGVGDGNFEPDRNISLAEASTVLLHVLKYGTARTGSVWPRSYMDLARSIGLLEGITTGERENIDRASAARLFVNALSCKTGEGEIYYKTLGTAADRTIILAVGVPTDDGSSASAIRTSANEKSEAYLAAAGEVKPTALLGKRGSLVLNERQEIVTFVPDESHAVTVTLSGDAAPSYLKGTDGKRYVMGAGTMLYTANADQGQSYSEGYGLLKSGAQVTLYSESGKITAVYSAGSSLSVGDSAVVVRGTPNEAMFHRLTGGAEGFRILKNGVEISMSALREYDVVTYDSLNNTLVVSDLRLTCIYEDAVPNAQAPTEITAAGTKFQVLDSAWDGEDKPELGQSMTLLFTTDGRVAGMVKNGKASGNALGVASPDGTIRMFLPNGDTRTLEGKLSGEIRKSQLVYLTSYRRGTVEVRTISSGRVPGDLDLKTMKLGNDRLSPGVRCYEQIGTMLQQVSLSGLKLEAIPASRVLAFHRNSSDMVDVILFSPLTGDTYEYGLIRKAYEQERDENGQKVEKPNYLSFANGSGEARELENHQPYRDGMFGGMALGKTIQDGSDLVASILELKEIKKVSPADFFQRNGMTYVNAGGRTYEVSDAVQCYKGATGSWFPVKDVENALAACRAFSNDLTVHIDPIGEKVRIVVAN